MAKPENSPFRNIFRSQRNELYWRKREALERLLRDHNDSLQALATRTFGMRRFPGYAITKRRVALELLNDNLSAPSFLLIREQIRRLAHLTDRRHTEEYAFDIVLGWLIEEFIVSQLQNLVPPSVVISRAGVGSSLSFQSKAKDINASADFELRAPGRQINVDIFADHKGTWKKNCALDLKAGKVSHLRDKTLDYVLGVDLLHGRFHLVSRHHLSQGTYLENRGMGGLRTLRVPLKVKMSIAAVSTRLKRQLRVT